MKVTSAFRARQAWKGRQVAMIGVAAVLAGLMMFSCTVKAPQVPSTDLTIRIPVADDRTMIQEVAEDRSEYLQIDPQNGQMALNVTAEINRQEIIGEDRLRVTPQGQTFQTPIGDITIPGQEVAVEPLKLGDLVTQAGVDIPTSGTAPLIPAFDIDQEVPVTLANINFVEIGEGSLTITIINEFPVDLNNMRLVLGSGSEEVGVLDLGNIPPGERRSDELDLSGKTLRNPLSIQVTGNSEQAQNVEVDDPRLEIEVVLSKLVVSRAEAIIPKQEFEDRQVLEFPDTRVLVDTARVKAGSLSLTVANAIPVIMSVELQLEDLTDKDGNVHRFVIPELSRDPVTHTFDLDGSEFAPINPEELRLFYKATTVETGEEVLIESGGEILVTAESEDLVFSLVKGRLDQLALPIDPVTETVDFPEGLENVGLFSTSLIAYLTSAVGLQSSIALDIEGTNNAGRTMNLRLEKIFERGSPDNPKTIEVAPDPGQLTDFLNLLPSRIEVTPTVLVGHKDSVSTIAPDHWVRVDSVVFKAPAKFRIKQDDQIRPTPEFREVEDEEARRRIRENLISAAVITNIESHVPLGVRVSLRVARQEADVYTNPDLKIPTDGTSFGVRAAPVDENGRVTSSVDTTQTISLTEEDVLVFLQKGGVYTGVLVEFDATDGDVELFGTDWVNVQAATEVAIELNEDLVE